MEKKRCGHLENGGRVRRCDYERNHVGKHSWQNLEFIDIPKRILSEKNHSPARFRVDRGEHIVKFTREVFVYGVWQESWLGGHLLIPNELKEVMAAALLKGM